MNRPNKRRENTKSALKSVGEVFDENSEIVSKMSALDTAVKEFGKDFAGYEVEEATYNLEMDGKTSAKHETADTLINVLHPLSRGLRSYSRKAKKADIFELVDVPESDLEKKRDTELLAHAKSVLKKANENAADLVPYNVTPEELADVQAKIDAFENALKAQGGSMADKSSEFDALNNSLRKVEEDLDDIDDIMERVKDKSPKFYDAYASARHVKALGTRHNKPPKPPDQTEPPKKD